MGQRPFFIIYDLCDYEGYDFNIRYIGQNRQAAIERYKEVIENVINGHFVEEGTPRDQLEISIDRRISGTIPVNYYTEFVPGKKIYSYINDQCEVYCTVALVIMKQGEFDIPYWEERYKQGHPNAKY